MWEITGMIYERSGSEDPGNDASSAKPREGVLSSTSARGMDLLWPVLAAILLTSWTRLRSTESGMWLTVALMCGPQAILYAAVESVRQRRAMRRGRLPLLMLTSPLLLLAASVACWIVLLVVTLGNGVYVVLEMGPYLAIAGVAAGYAVPVGLLGYTHLIGRRPSIGVLLGLVGIGLVGARFLSMALDYRNFLAQGGPIPLQCHDVAATGVRARQWATLSGGLIPGILRPQAHRNFPASLFLGEIDHTEIALLEPGTGTWIDLWFEGRSGEPSYWGPFTETFEGILTRTDDRLWGGDVSAELVQALHDAPARNLYLDATTAGLRGRPTGELYKGPVGVLHVRATPSTARSEALVSLAILSMLGWFTLHCARKQYRQLRARGPAGHAPDRMTHS